MYSTNGNLKLIVNNIWNIICWIPLHACIVNISQRLKGKSDAENLAWKTNEYNSDNELYWNIINVIMDVWLSSKPINFLLPTSSKT